MGSIQPVLPVNLIVGMLSSDESLFEMVETRLEKELGPVDLASGVIPFNFTDYYKKEMGESIGRKFVSFKKLIEPDGIAPIKVFTNRMEESFSAMHSPVSRPINLDPSYIASSKLVLATTKDYAHRILLREGIYAEVTLRYVGDRFEPLPWTYPDYKTKEYLGFFSRVRGLYLNKLKRQVVEA
ncbi:MAG: DUF4416 family protein [Candidatus Brocadiales bacterium]